MALKELAEKGVAMDNAHADDADWKAGGFRKEFEDLAQANGFTLDQLMEEVRNLVG